MTQGEILQKVRDRLGEQEEGTWSDAELARYLDTACADHAKLALSVEASIVATTIYGKQEYVLPADFGELRSVGVQWDDDDTAQPLEYVKKDVIDRWNQNATLWNHRPYAFYKEEDTIGLYPTPGRPPVFSWTFDRGGCKRYAPIFDFENERVYQNTWEFQVILPSVDAADADVSSVSAYPAVPSFGPPGTGLHNPAVPVVSASEPSGFSQPDYAEDPCRLYICAIDIYLRNDGRIFPGHVFMAMVSTDRPEHTQRYSMPISASQVGPTGGWVTFDFSANPFEVTEDALTWRMTLHTDKAYTDWSPAQGGGEGVQIGIESADQAWFRLHELREDLVIRYYRNVCDSVADANDVPQVKPRYHEDLVKMTAAQALRKGSVPYQLALADRYETESKQQMGYARAQAKVPTQGDRLPEILTMNRMRMRAELSPYDTATGRWSFQGVRFG